MILKLFDRSDEKLPSKQRGVALGFFDGVHRGHSDLIRTLILNCSRLELEPAVFTFDEHPATVAHKRKRFGGYINTLNERLQLFEEIGISEVHHYHFDEEFCRLAPVDFLNDIIAKRLDARLLVVGADYRFGYKGEGNIDTLRKWCADHNVELTVVPDVDLHGQRISSTRIRQLIEQGDMPMTSSCLGRHFSLRGQVVRGRRLGRELGFPTANFTVAEGQIKPSYGVYVTRTRVGQRTWWSITSFGLRPTVSEGDIIPMVETYIYDTKMNLYGQEIEVFFLEKLRDEIKFESLLQLSTKIQDDLKQAYEWHQSSEDSYISNYVKDIPVWLLQSDRFAQGSLQLVFQQRLDKKNASLFELLLQVLTSGCRRFPGRVELSTELDRLYGSSIDSNIHNYGDIQNLFLTVDGLVNWTDSSQPFAEAARLLFDILFDPQLDEEGNFIEAIFESERQNMITELKARENDRARYAYDRSIDLLCGDQPHGIRSGGSIEELNALSLSDLKNAYSKLLNELPVMVCIGGRIDSYLLEDIYENLNRFPSARNQAKFGSMKPSALVVPENEISLDEHRKLEQARVNLILTGLPPYFSHRSIVSSMLNSMLGGDVHSLLFDVVREKMGLAYSVYSSASRYLAAIFIIAGIEPTKTEDAIEAMKKQVADLAAGNFDDRLMDTSRRMLSASIEASHDDLGHMVSAVVSAVVLGRNMSRSDALSLLDAVSRQDIMEMAGMLKLAVSYRLLPDRMKEDDEQ
ncbi:MAG: bifunctional riboflavin kinase/FAD synthetase [Clostridiaceae bacterium]|nr:bifunctional riboflavin kinase/FAD synthetase [Clostridiaceae bacterium]